MVVVVGNLAQAGDLYALQSTGGVVAIAVGGAVGGGEGLLLAVGVVGVAVALGEGAVVDGGAGAPAGGVVGVGAGGGAAGVGGQAAGGVVGEGFRAVGGGRGGGMVGALHPPPRGVVAVADGLAAGVDLLH